MKRIPTTQYAIFTVLAVFVMTLVVGCSGGSGSKDLTAEVSGTWQRAEGDGVVEINLAKEPLTVTLDGKTYPATVVKVNNGAYSMHIKVDIGDGQAEEWILRQVWSDNGSDFTLALTHNGINENLIPKKSS